MKIVKQEKEKHYEALGTLKPTNDRTSVELVDCFLVVNV